MPRDSVDWTNYGLTAFCASLAAIGVAFVPGLEALRWWLGGVGVVFFALSVVFFGLAVYRVPLMPILLSKYRQKSRLREHEQARRQEEEKWQTAKKLEVAVVKRYSRVYLLGMHDLAPGAPQWPSLTGLKGKARGEILNRYKRPVKLFLRLGIFDSLGVEIQPVEVTKLTGTPVEIGPLRSLEYSMEMCARFACWIKPETGAGVFLVVEISEGGRRIARIEDIVFD